MRKDKKSKCLKSGKAINVLYLTLPFRLQSNFIYAETERKTEYLYFGEFSTLAGINVVNELT